MGARQMNKNKKDMRGWAPERIRDVIIGRGGYLFVWLCDHWMVWVISYTTPGAQGRPPTYPRQLQQTASCFSLDGDHTKGYFHFCSKLQLRDASHKCVI